MSTWWFLRGSEDPANCSSFLLVVLNHIRVVYEWEVSVFGELRAAALRRCAWVLGGEFS